MTRMSTRLERVEGNTNTCSCPPHARPLGNNVSAAVCASDMPEWFAVDPCSCNRSLSPPNAAATCGTCANVKEQIGEDLAKANEMAARTREHEVHERVRWRL